MPDDLKVIKKIEKTIGIKFMKFFGFGFTTTGFALDDGGRVVGLNLRDCKLTDISVLQPLTQLKELYLPGNQLTDISPLQPLTQLETVWLQNNKITRLPAFIAQWDMEIMWRKGYYGDGLALFGNPLETPPITGSMWSNF